MFDYKGHVTKSTKGALHFQHFTLQCKGYMFTSCHKITSLFMTLARANVEPPSGFAKQVKM